jgi:CIC family chloride channel protein
MDYIKEFILKLKKEDYLFNIITAICTGLAAGFACVVLISGINSLTEFMTAIITKTTWLCFILPTAGALLVGPIIKFISPEIKGGGVSNVISSTILNNGRVRFITPVTKIIASILTIGSGGSAGREGPAVQIGSGIGSMIAQILGLNERKTLTLLAAGAAAGISAVFNAPIAGVMFATEIIMRRFGVKEFGSVIIASVSSSMVTHSFFGNDRIFEIPDCKINSNAELVLYCLLGILCAPLAFSFVKILDKTETIFEKIKVPSLLKPAIGGLLCGSFLYFTPQIYGTGFPAISGAINGEFTITMIIILIVAKIFATSCTIGSGGSGGIFAPLLFVGAFFGNIFEKTCSFMFPASAEKSAVYPLVAMGATFAAVSKAPITSILLLFEITGNYNIVLPTLIAVIASTIAANKIFKESIYTYKLASEGVNTNEILSRTFLDNIRIEEVMLPENKILKVPASMPIRDLEAYFHMNNSQRSLVIDSKGKLYGTVGIRDLYKKPDKIDSGIVADISTTKVFTIRPDDSIEDATIIFGSKAFHTLPVVDVFDRKKIVGLLRREDVVELYSNIMKKKYSDVESDKKNINSVCAELLELRVGKNFKCIGAKIVALPLPEKCSIVTIFRNNEQIIPNPQTIIESGDELVFLCPNADKVIKALRGET